MTELAERQRQERIMREAVRVWTMSVEIAAYSGRRQNVRRRNQPMPSAIQRVSMGESATPATTNQNCVSERLRIGMMSHVDQTRREKSSDAAIFNTQRPDSVVSNVTNTSDCSFF